MHYSTIRMAPSLDIVNGDSAIICLNGIWSLDSDNGLLVRGGGGGTKYDVPSRTLRARNRTHFQGQVFRARLRVLEALGLFSYSLVLSETERIFKHSDTKFDKKHSQSNFRGPSVASPPPPPDPPLQCAESVLHWEQKKMKRMDERGEKRTWKK